MSCFTCTTPIKRSILTSNHNHRVVFGSFKFGCRDITTTTTTTTRRSKVNSTRNNVEQETHVHRRVTLTTPILVAVTTTLCADGLATPSSSSAAAPVGIQPPLEGDCPDCIGEVNSTLNTCPLSSESCVSTLNDDELHFAAPWQYEGTPATAVDELIRIATGGDYEPGLIAEPFGVSRLEAAGYVVKGVLAVLQNGSMPERPERQRATEIDRFDGRLVERKTTDNGSEYVRIVFGAGDEEGNEAENPTQNSLDPSRVLDAEFLFLVNDSIVNIRAKSRGDPGAKDGELALSFTSGLMIDRNIARRKMEALRTALRWEPAPVITDFDPKFNPEAPVWLEKVFRPFDTERNNFQPSGIPYPTE